MKDGGLRALSILETLERLQLRIEERFPDSGLLQVTAALHKTAGKTARRARSVARPFRFVRMLVVLAILSTVGGLGYLVQYFGLHQLLFADAELVELTQALESAANLLIFGGILIWFLIGLEQRLRRHEVLVYLHELRSFAHVIDMHQLTKDPTVVLSGATRTRSSPERNMSRFELARYLDYCSELLALIGKLSALFAEHTHDTEIVAAVNDVETLTTNLGRKIWQKIMIIGELDENE